MKNAAKVWTVIMMAWILMLGDLVIMAALILTHENFMMLFALLILPAGALIYYLRLRELFLPPRGDWLFPLVFIVAMSLFNDILIISAWHLSTHLSLKSSLWLGLGFTSALVFFGVVVLLELIHPAYFPRWRGVPLVGAWMIAILWANGAAYPGWDDWISWNPVGGIAIGLLLNAALLWAFLRDPRSLQHLLGYYLVTYLLIMCGGVAITAIA